MNRKSFLAATAALFSSPSFAGKSVVPGEEDEAPVIPKYLGKGDWIGVTAPAGYITQEGIQPAVDQMKSWGFFIKTGDTIGKRDATFAGTDAERLADFQRMLDDPSLKAIMCARGGYGAVRIIDQLNWEKFKKHPKWIIGFSDATVFHSHINRNIGVASLHSKMTNSFPEEWTRAEPVQVETIYSIRDALRGVKMEYAVTPNSNNRNGKAQGILVGGNLKTIESLAGSSSDLITDNKILFVEDTGEYLYSIDRMFWNLKRSGKLSRLKALVVGGFKVKPSEDPAEEFGKNLYAIVMEKVKEYKYPVCFDFPVGHQRNNFALKCGVTHNLAITNDKVIFHET